MFPRQFGLHSVFTHITDRRETTHAFKDYTDREGEIASARKDRDEKVYRRLGIKVLPLIRKMQRLHQQCSYHSLVHYYGSPISDDSGKDGGEMSLESEKDTSKLLTQKEVSIIASGTLVSGSQQTSQDENIIRHHTPHYKVLPLDNLLRARLPRSFVRSSRRLFQSIFLAVNIIALLSLRVCSLEINLINRDQRTYRHQKI